jgi:hypothetical protein
MTTGWSLTQFYFTVGPNMFQRCTVQNITYHMNVDRRFHNIWRSATANLKSACICNFYFFPHKSNFIMFFSPCQFNTFNIFPFINLYCFFHKTYFMDYKICPPSSKQHLKTAEVPMFMSINAQHFTWKHLRIQTTMLGPFLTVSKT